MTPPLQEKSPASYSEKREKGFDAFSDMGGEGERAREKSATTNFGRTSLHLTTTKKEKYRRYGKGRKGGRFK